MTTELLLSENAIQWLANGERGLSSNTLFKYTTGVDATKECWGDHYPLDPADLRRCVQLLNKCPELLPRLKEVAKAGPVWAALIERWDELTVMLEKEIKKGTGKAPLTYELMQQIIQSAA